MEQHSLNANPTYSLIFKFGFLVPRSRTVSFSLQSVRFKYIIYIFTVSLSVPQNEVYSDQLATYYAPLYVHIYYVYVCV